MSELGTRINQKRIENNMTMAELAARLGVQASAVNKWEKGIVTNIKRGTIQEMARIFNVSPVWLAYGFDEIPVLEPPKQQATEDIELVMKYHSLTQSNQVAVMTMIDSLLRSQDKV